MTSRKNKPRLLVTSGEPAGIGPDLIIKLSQMNHDYDLTVIGDPDLFLHRAKLLSVPTEIITVSNKLVVQDSQPNVLNVIPVKLKTISSPGKLNIQNADYVLKTLDLACDSCLTKKYDAVITTPIQKSVINDAGIKFSGHTEYFAKQCNNAYPVMLLACPDLRVALVTTHLPLHDVPNAITPERVDKTIRIVIEAMIKQFGIEKPLITVCGLNPHAGEDGHLGTEEINIINPVIENFIRRGFNISGSLPADTAFRIEQREKTDVFVCMYHDQGLPVLKTLGFGEAVNITLGLPIIRTSVDHGTALDLAGTGKAQCGSLLAAIEMADSMARHKINSKAAATN
ncbi:MAG: 4-hydroxythreonine-4-phosphate dehydrogenase PdxA [Proteobacteria bacterium]|nr:4-hydroxythreonine-4-phosphate dehydrogenase PdxA [Pseudomonadota bacterium]NOG59855.1 4-hydroxythreonine-4-phosphate dehydrogenase PdxA [Pseudomonadota bacterium]